MVKTYYLDDDDNIVSKEKSTKYVIHELDENGNLIKETFGRTKIPDINYNDLVDTNSKEVRGILDNITDQNGNYIFRK